MSYPEKQYHRQETSKEYTKVYTLNNEDEIPLKQSEDGMLGYVSVGDLKSFTRSYGSFYDMTTQSGSANTAYTMKLGTTDFAVSSSIQNAGRIQVEKTGKYNLQFSAQLTNTANSNITFDIWLAYTGSNYSNSNTQIDVNKTAGSLGRQVAAWNWIVPIVANDYVEIKWSCNAATGQIFATGSQTSPDRPGIPSVIATISQIA